MDVPNLGAVDSSLAAAGRPRSILIIFNKTAGWRRQRRVQAVVDALHRRGCGVVIKRTKGPGHAVELARDAGQVDVVAVAGGDGTINEAVNGLAAAGPALGLIPCGTANVFALELGYPFRPDDIARVLAEGPAARIWLGEAQGRRFVQMAGVGFDAHVVRGVRPATKRLLGRGAFVLETLRQALRYGYPAFRVRVDGIEHAARSVIVSKGRLYAGPYLVAPEAAPTSDRLVVSLFDKWGWWAIIRYGLALLAGRMPGDPGIRRLPAERVVIEAPAGEPVQADGDLLGETPIEVSLAAIQVRVIVPGR
jgi:YegS/Rv2252/BmrU family lipid kinase